jgi:hypothetical protein
MWQPEIMYEESSDEQGQNFPFIPVPVGESMPHLLYIYESRDTGETETGQDGNQYPVMQWDMHQYADMSRLKTHLSEEVFDQVRVALGLDPLRVALEKAEKNSKNNKNNLE